MKIEKCPICQGSLIEISEGVFYCEKDDISFKLDKGRMKVASDSELREFLAAIQTEQADQRMTLEKVIKKLVPQDKQKEFWE